jgi:hypothetical protein
MYGRIENDKTDIGLPHSGVLSDGRTVSNYHLLPQEILTSEGWLPVEEVKPVYDESTQKLARDTVTSDGKTITVTYKVAEREIPDTEALAALTEAIG